MTVVWIAITAVSVGVAFYSHNKLPVILTPRYINKPYSNWTDFYPFYLSQHEDPVCRVLHFLGTLISHIYVITKKPQVILSLLTALSIGYILCEVLSGYPNGFIEFGIMGLIYFGGNLCLTKTIGWELPLLAYAFAWVGHFFFEHNRPATFLYPSYSLMGDYRMLYDTVRGFIN